jgi:hypothetical protein
MNNCYMCEDVATSVEHVPPKCIFPEFKDSGEELRVNLITVPSCNMHNCAKSRDDEFLMISIAGIIGNNSIGYQHAKSKGYRAIKRTAFGLLDQVFITKHEITRIDGENEFLDFLWGTPDYDRLINCFEHIAFGIYYHHFKEKFTGSLKTYLGFLHSNENNPKEFKRMMEHLTERDLQGRAKYGSNQQVFYYQYSELDEFGLFMVKFCFYDNVDIFVSYIPEDSTSPTSLPMELVNAGIKTIIQHNDEVFEFNNDED